MKQPIFNDIAANEAYKSAVRPVRKALERCVAIYRDAVDYPNEKNRAFKDSLLMVTDYLSRDLRYDLEDIGVMCGIKAYSVQARLRIAEKLWQDAPYSCRGRQILDAWRKFSEVMPESRQAFENEIELWTE